MLLFDVITYDEASYHGRSHPAESPNDANRIRWFVYDHDGGTRMRSFSEFRVTMLQCECGKDGRHRKASPPATLLAASSCRGHHAVTSRFSLCPLVETHLHHGNIPESPDNVAE